MVSTESVSYVTGAACKWVAQKHWENSRQVMAWGAITHWLAVRGCLTPGKGEGEKRERHGKRQIEAIASLKIVALGRIFHSNGRRFNIICTRCVQQQQHASEWHASAGSPRGE